MTSFYQARKPVRQLEVLHETLHTILQYAKEAERTIVPSQNVFDLLNQIQKSLEKADLSKLPLEHLLNDLIACCFNRQGNMNATSAKQVQVIGARLVERARDFIADNDFDAAYRMFYHTCTPTTG